MLSNDRFRTAPCFYLWFPIYVMFLCFIYFVLFSRYLLQNRSRRARDPLASPSVSLMRTAIPRLPFSSLRRVSARNNEKDIYPRDPSYRLSTEH